MNAHMHKNAFALLRRITATGLAMLVLVLTALAASPTLHEKLHTDADHADHECAIVLYASGITTTVAVSVQPAPVTGWEVKDFAPAVISCATDPQQLHPPVCGPPQV